MGLDLKHFHFFLAGSSSPEAVLSLHSYAGTATKKVLSEEGLETGGCPPSIYVAVYIYIISYIYMDWSLNCNV